MYSGQFTGTIKFSVLVATVPEHVHPGPDGVLGDPRCSVCSARVYQTQASHREVSQTHPVEFSLHVFQEKGDKETERLWAL